MQCETKKTDKEITIHTSPVGIIEKKHECIEVSIYKRKTRVLHKHLRARIQKLKIPCYLLFKHLASRRRFLKGMFVSHPTDAAVCVLLERMSYILMVLG